MVDRSLTGRCEDVIAIELLRERGVDELTERFMEHRGKLRAMMKARLPCSTGDHLIEDVLQSTFAAAADQLPAYISHPGLPIFHWLRSLGLKQLRSAQAAAKYDDAEYSHRVAQELSQSMLMTSDETNSPEIYDAIERTLADLPELDQQILGLRHLEQLTISEAACEVGTTTDTAKERYRAILRQLSRTSQGLRP